MEKLIYLLGDAEPRGTPARADLREAWVGAGPRLAAAGARSASFHGTEGLRLPVLTARR